MKSKGDPEEDLSKVKLEFNYEFLEDESGRKDTNECWKQWKIEEHPLTLMVSYF